MREPKVQSLRNFPKSSSWWVVELGLEPCQADLEIPETDLKLLLFSFKI